MTRLASGANDGMSRQPSTYRSGADARIDGAASCRLTPGDRVPGRTGWMLAHSGDADIHYEVVGRGRPCIMLHGSPGTDHTYLRFGLERLLAEDLEMIFLDHRAHGRSSAGTARLSFEIIAADIEAVRKHLGLDSVAVLGHSFGGMVAQFYATLHQSTVTHLVLVG